MQKRLTVNRGFQQYWRYCQKAMPSLLLLLSIALAGPASALGRKAATPVAQLQQAGEYPITLADKRKYLLYVPSSVELGKPAPLLLFFHGGGGNMQQAADAYGWRETADRFGFVVAFPNGYSRLPRGNLATWNAGNCCGDARDKQVDDIGFVKALLADVKQRLVINPQQIFASGMSNGGMLSHRLACEMADTFAGIAAVAGTDNTKQCRPSRAIPILHIHALDDTHVLYQGGAGEDAFRDESKVTDFTSVAETIKRWRERNQLQSVDAQIQQLPGATIETYQNANARLRLITTESGGHSWPGSEPVRGKQPSNAIDANTQIWQFFLGQN